MPLLLDMFCKISKNLTKKKIGKLTEVWNEKRPTLLYPRIFVGMQEYTPYCVFQLFIDF